MKFSIRFADKIVGAFVLTALVILVLVIFMLGKSQRWFSRDYQFVTYFTSAEGLSPNMSVLYKGFTIGHVKRIKLNDDDRVEVLFTIFDEHFHRVKEGSLVEAQVSPIGLGNKFIFVPGKGRFQLIEGSIIPSVDSAEGKKLIALGLADAPEKDAINALMGQVEMAMEDVNSIISDVNSMIAMLEEGLSGSDRTSIGRTLGNVELATSDLKDIAKDLNTEIGDILSSVNPILENIETVTNRLSAPGGTVMSILDAKEPVYKDIVSVMDSVAGVMNNLEKISDFIPSQLPQIAVLVSDLHTALKSAEDLMIALVNNPLLKGGAPEHKETGPGGASPRDLNF